MTEDEDKENGYEVYSIPEVFADEAHPAHQALKEILEKLERGELDFS